MDTTLSTADFAAAREEHQPNSRHQFDNIITYSASGCGGEHLIKAGVQWGRLYYESQQTVLGDHYVEYTNGAADAGPSVEHAGQPEEHRPHDRLLLPGRVVDRSRLTLNLGMRYDTLQGHPAGSVESAAVRSSPRAASPETEAINQKHRPCGAPARRTT